MDIILEIANDEISLEGSRGCPLPKLWQLLDARMPIKVVGEDLTSLPDVVKQQLWLLLKAPGTPYTFAISNGDKAAAEAAPMPQQVPKGRKGKKRKAEEELEEEEEDLVAAAAAKGIPLMNGQPVMCFMGAHLAEVPLDEVPDDLAAATQLGIHLVAPVAARLAALRVDDALISTYKLNATMFSVLEILGRNRKVGHVQIDMCKALNAVPRNFFYVLKHLEVRNLVVRHKLLVQQNTNTQWTQTSIVHHTRFMPASMFGPHCVLQEVLGSLRRQTGEVHGVRDDSVNLRQVCDLIRKSGEHQTVMEMQLKQVMGFTAQSGHRQWRRLRNKLVRLGYIEVLNSEVEEKTKAVVRLLRNYTGGPLISAAKEARLAARKAAAGAQQLYSEDEEEPESSDGDDGGADAADGDADGEGDADEGDKEVGSVPQWEQLTVETSFTRTALQLLCNAGPQGIMTTDLAASLNMTVKSLVKRVHELVKRFSLEVAYDVRKKAITNRIIAPPALIASWRAANPSCFQLAAPASPLPAPPALLALPAPTLADLVDEEEEDASSAPGAKRQRLANGSAAAAGAALDSERMEEDVAEGQQQPAAAAAGGQAQDVQWGRRTAGATAAGGLLRETWAPVTLVAQQRLKVLHQHLLEHGFLLKKEVRRVLRHAGVEQDRPQGVAHRGVDFKTTNRLLGLMVHNGSAKHVVLNATTAVVTPGAESTRSDDIEAVVLPDLEVTDDIQQRIMAHNRELARLLHQDNTQKFKEARQQAITDSRKRSLPVALLGPLAGGRGALAACPAAADAMQLPFRDSVLPRKMRRGERLGPVTAVLAVSADAVFGKRFSSGESEDGGEEAAVNEGAAGGAQQPAAPAPGPGAWAGVLPARPAAAQEVLLRRRAKQQLDRDEGSAHIVMLGNNGYIHTRLVRARLLHKYLCKLAGLAGNPPFTAPELAPPDSQQQQRQQRQARASTAAFNQSQLLPVGAAGSFRLLNIPLQSSAAAAEAAATEASRGAAGTASTAATGSAAAAGAGGRLIVKAANDDGVALLVSDVWSYMPMELALQVVGSCQDAGAAFIAAVEAGRVVGQLSREEVQALWDNKYRHRLQTTLNILTRLGLVASMDSESILVSSKIRAELPQVSSQPAVHKEYNLAGEGGGRQLQQYWKDLQAAYTTEFIALDVKNRCFPGSQTTDIMKPAAWVDGDAQQLPLLGYLKVQAHLSGVPVSSMNYELAEQLAAELSLPYDKVQKVVQHRRQKVNSLRAKQGKPRIAIAGDSKRRRPSCRRKHSSRGRRARRQQQGEGADTEHTGASAEEGGSGSDSDSESGAGGEEAALRRLDRLASRSSSRARGIPVVVVSVLPPAPGTAAAVEPASGGPPPAAPAAAGESGGGSSAAAAPQGQQEADAALRVLQEVDQDVEEGDPERLQDVEALDQYGSLPAGEGGAQQASRRSTMGGRGDDAVAEVATSDEEGGVDVTVPVRVNRRRIKWRHHMDQELLKIVLLQRAEVGFHAKHFWSRLKGLPASIPACHKRYKLLQRKLPEALQQLEGQALQVHDMLVERRRTLQQRLYALPAAHVWTRRPRGVEASSMKRAVLAAHHHQLQQEGATAGSSQQPPADPAAAAAAEACTAGGAAGAAAGDAAGAAAGGANQAQGMSSLHEALVAADSLLAAGQLNLAAGGPVLVTPGGNVVLLPNATEQALLDQVSDNLRQVRYKRVVKYSARKERAPGEGPRRQRAPPGEGGRKRRKQAVGSWKAARKQRQAMQHLEKVLHPPHGSDAEDWEEVGQEGAGATAAAWATGHWSIAGSKGSRGKGTSSRLSPFAAHASAAAWRAAGAMQVYTRPAPTAAPGAAAPSVPAQGAASSAAAAPPDMLEQQQQQQHPPSAAGLDSITSIIAGPPLPVAKAVELLVTLLYMSQSKGSGGGLSATALTCRFPSDVIVAAFKWAKALGWVQMGTTKKPLALSRTWLTQAHRDPVITRLLMAGAAADAELAQQLQLTAATSAANQLQQVVTEEEVSRHTRLFQPSSSGYLVGPVGHGPLLLQLLHRAFLGTLRLSLCQERPPEDREGPVLLLATPQTVRVAAAVPGPEEAGHLVVVRDAGVLPGALLEDLAHLLVYTRQAGDAPAGLATADTSGSPAPPAAASPSPPLAPKQPLSTVTAAPAIAAAVAEQAGLLVYAASDVAHDAALRQAAEAACWAALQQSAAGEAAASSVPAAQEVLQHVRAAGGAGTTPANLLTQQLQRDGAAASTGAVEQWVATAIRQLRAHGLVRVITGWATPLLVASEASQELLAFPSPSPTAAARGAPSDDQSADIQQQQQQQEQQQSGEAMRVVLASGPAGGSTSSSQGGGGEVLLAPWLGPGGRLVPELWQGLVARAVGAVLRSPGIPEPLLMQQLDIISPGSAAALLEALVAQGMLRVKAVALPSPPACVVRKTMEAIGAAALLTGAAPPSFLRRRRGTAAGGQGAQPSVVRHYWPSLENSWSAPARAQPPMQVVCAATAAGPAGAGPQDVHMQVL